MIHHILEVAVAFLFVTVWILADAITNLYREIRELKKTRVHL